MNKDMKENRQDRREARKNAKQRNSLNVEKAFRSGKKRERRHSRFQPTIRYSDGG